MGILVQLLLLIPLFVSLQSIEISPVQYVLISQDLSIEGVNQIPEYAEVGEQLTISTTIQSHTDEQSFTVIMDIRNSADVSTYLELASGNLQPESNKSISISWSPSAADDYQVRTFAVDDLQTAEILSPIRGTRLEVIDSLNTRVTFIERAPNTTFGKAEFTLEQAQDMLKRVWRENPCTLYSYTQDSNPEEYEYFMPQRVHFEYLEPAEPVIRLGCNNGPSGLNYAYLSLANGTIAGVESSLTIRTPEQAAEYLRMFPRSDVVILYTEDALQRGFESATQIDISPVKRMHVIDDGNALVVKMNVLDPHNSQIRYEKWDIERYPDALGFHEWNPSQSVVIAKLHYAA